MRLLISNDREALILKPLAEISSSKFRLKTGSEKQFEQFWSLAFGSEKSETRNNHNVLGGSTKNKGGWIFEYFYLESQVSWYEKENGHHCQWVWIIVRDEWSGLQAKRIELPSQVGDTGDQRKL